MGQIIYMACPIQGRWELHAKLANAILGIICDDLKKEGMIKNITRTEYLDFSKIDINKKPSFFGKHSDWSSIIRELEYLKNERNLILNAHINDCGFYIVRCEDTGSIDKDKLSLRTVLESLQRRGFSGFTYCIIPPVLPAQKPIKKGLKKCA